jgi:uncharacterized protein with von Willebrand factor type A (vWA) domain
MPERGRLADNVMHFARVLRKAGLPIGPAGVLDALQALEAVGLERRDDFYHALSTVLVVRREQQALFDQAFDLFWRTPAGDRRTAGLRDLLSGVRAAEAAKPPVSPRIAQALLPGATGAVPRVDELPPELALDAAMTMSPREALQSRDFALMSAEELAESRRMLASLRMPLPEIPARRARPSRRRRDVDLRATLRDSVRCPDSLVALRHRAPRRRQATLVVLCDISGSMERYSRMLLHFVHALSNKGGRVHAFLFGTRLSNITRPLRDRDVDVALGQVSSQVADWAGGTRIGACLQEFNRCWSRRLLGQGAVVLLITDGLDSEDAQGLGAEMERLHLSCRRLLWINPLLRFAGFAPKPAGIRAMLPHVDVFLPAHDLDSLTRLGALLGAAGDRRPAPANRSPHLGVRHGNV